jgi:hypothetical protein
MEELIKQAFLHVDVIGPHVQAGHYDLLGPDQEIILPQVWDKVIEPNWAITMVMWPMDRQRHAGPPGGHHTMHAMPGMRPATMPPQGAGGGRMPPGVRPMGAPAHGGPPVPPPGPMHPGLMHNGRPRTNIPMAPGISQVPNDKKSKKKPATGGLFGALFAKPQPKK